MPKTFERDASGELATFTSVGGYPLYYLDNENNVLCPDCANEEEEGAIVDCDANWEDETLYCDGCSKHIVSAYGDDEE